MWIVNLTDTTVESGTNEFVQHVLDFPMINV